MKFDKIKNCMSLPKFSNEVLQKSLASSIKQSQLLVKKFLKFDHVKLISKIPMKQYRINIDNFEKAGAENKKAKIPDGLTSDHLIQKIERKISPNNFSVSKNSGFNSNNQKLKGQKVYKSKINIPIEVSDLNKQILKEENDLLSTRSEKEKHKSKINLS